MKNAVNQVFARNAPWSDAVEVMLGRANEGIRYVGKVTFSRIEPGETPDGPSVVLDHEGAQRLMDELWTIGLRPRNGSGALAHVDAVQAHLEDLRRLVFKTK